MSRVCDLTSTTYMHDCHPIMEWINFNFPTILLFVALIVFFFILYELYKLSGLYSGDYK